MNNNYRIFHKDRFLKAIAIIMCGGILYTAGHYITPFITKQNGIFESIVGMALIICGLIIIFMIGVIIKSIIDWIWERNF